MRLTYHTHNYAIKHFEEGERVINELRPDAKTKRIRVVNKHNPGSICHDGTIMFEGEKYYTSDAHYIPVKGTRWENSR